MNVKKENNKIIFEFPAERPRNNSYMPEGEQHLLGTYPMFTGLIVHHRRSGDDEMGFAGTIDMDYAGKPDQVSDIIVAWWGNEITFREKCRELGIAVVEMRY